jgi:polysaccharide biosynthesis transport protein
MSGNPALAPRPTGRFPGAYWSRIRRHGGRILGLSLLCGLLAALVAHSAPPLYEAQTTLLAGTPGDGGRTPLPAGRGSVHTDIALLQSRILAETVTDQLRLWDAPGLDPRQRGLVPSWIPPRWSAWLGDVLARTESRTTWTEAQARAAAVAEIGRRLKVEAIPESEVIRLSFTAQDPALAARVANAFADTFVPSNRWTAPPPAEGQGPTGLAGSFLPELAERLSEARARRDGLQDLRDRMQRPATRPGTELIAHPVLATNLALQSLKAAELQAEREVSALATRYGPQHPKMAAALSDLDTARAMLDSETRNAVASLDQDLDSALAEVQRIEVQIQVLQSPSGDSRPLTPAGAGSWNLYPSQVPARVVDRALVPSDPVDPKTARIIAGGALFGLGTGLLITLLGALLDRRLRSPRDIEEGLQLPVLSTIPLVSRRQRRKVPIGRLFADLPTAPFAEAIRTLRTHVLLSGAGDAPGLVLVTSAGRGEGKTTVAMGLALAFGKLGKALLIDADLRHATAAASLGVPTAAPGLADLVAGTADEGACIQSVAGANIEVLPPGAALADPLEIFSSPRFAETLHRLRQSYSHIVIESAAADATSDALMLSTVSDAVVLVIRADATALPQAQTAVKHLRRVGAPLIGAALNGAGKASEPSAPHPERRGRWLPPWPSTGASGRPIRP